MKQLWNIVAWAICLVIVPIGMFSVWAAFNLHAFYAGLKR